MGKWGDGLGCRVGELMTDGGGERYDGSCFVVEDGVFGTCFVTVTFEGSVTGGL